MEEFGQIFNLMIAFYGFRSLFDWLRLRSAGHLLPSRILCPNGKKPSECRDAEAYYRKMMPVYLVFSVCAALCGSLNVLESILHFSGIGQLPILLFGVLAAAVVIFGIFLKRNIAAYWQ